MKTITEESDDHYGLTDEFGVIIDNDKRIRVYRRLTPGSEAVRGFELSSEEAELLKDWLNEHIHIKSEYRFVSDQEDRPWNKTW
jgi:hypothetical protein